MIPIVDLAHYWVSHAKYLGFCGCATVLFGNTYPFIIWVSRHDGFKDRQKDMSRQDKLLTKGNEHLLQALLAPNSMHFFRFPFNSSPYKMVLDFWDCFRRKKTLSYNRRNMVCHVFYLQLLFLKCII